MTDLPSSCDVSDACDELGLEAVRTGVFRPVWSGCPPVAGAIATVRLEPATDAPSPLPALLAVLESLSAGLVVVDLGGRVDHQCWGSVLATFAQRRGISAALVNGAARDVDELRALSFPTYSRGVHPASANGRLRFVASQQPVELEGGRVEPGSYAVADANGAVFLPATRAEEVLELARRLRAEEEQRLSP